MFGTVLTGAGLVLTPPLRDRAAQLAVPTSVLVGPSAARRHGLAVRDLRTVIAVGPDSHLKLPGVRLLREHVPEPDLDLVDGLLVTRRARTVVDCLRILDERKAVDLLDRALQAKQISPEELAVRVHRFAGRHGAKRLARLSGLAGSGARSTAERIVVEFLRRSGVSGWTANAEIWDERGLIGVGDVVFEARRLVVEIDGRAHHSGPAEFQRDRAGRTGSSGRAGRCSGSPGGIWSIVRRMSCPQFGQCSHGPPDDRRLRSEDAVHCAF